MTKGALVPYVLVLISCPSCRSPQSGTDRADSGSTATGDSGVEESGPDAGLPADAGRAIEGEIMIDEVTYVDQLPRGLGLEIDLRFYERRAPVLEDTPGSAFGCKVYEYAIPSSPPSPSRPEGRVTIAARDGSPVVPPCDHDGATGYACVGSSGTGGRISRVINDSFRFDTDPTTPWSDDDLGRYVEIEGAAHSGNNGAFPIVLVASASSLWFYNPSPNAAEEALPSSATWTIRAGGGPAPNVAEPGVLADDDELDIELDAGGDLDLASFTSRVEVGDTFRLDGDSTYRIANVPADSSEFSFACSTCGTADVTLLRISTTDAPVEPAPAPRSTFPPPIAKAVHIRCLVTGPDPVTVPAAASEFIRRSGASRIRTAYVRANRSSALSGTVSVYAGHGAVGFTNPGVIFCDHNPYQCAEHQLHHVTNCTCLESCEAGFTWNPGTRSCL